MPEFIDWGLFPEKVLANVYKREWENRRNLKLRLQGQREFPIEISLKAPTGQQASADLEHFHHFYKVWSNFTYPDLVEWQERNYRQLGVQRVPVKLKIPTLHVLAELLATQEQLDNWLYKI